MLAKAKRGIGIVVAFLMIATLIPYVNVISTHAEGASVDEVIEAIGELGNDPRDFTAADAASVEAIWSDYEALSAEDQATVDSTFNHPSGDGQSYGRVLEAALWAVRSFGTDTSTTLGNGTYTTTTDPFVISESDKGKSDSSRIRNWWVDRVVVENGQATAYIYVTDGDATKRKLTSYPSVWIGGETINREADNTYPIPVDLNGLTYFGGISSSMPRPIMYSLLTQIEEPEDTTQRIDLDITNNTGMFKAVTAYLEIADGQTTLVMALSAAGYRNLFKGTYEEAVANGDNTDNWIAGYENAEGKLEFRIPVEEGDSYMPLVAISQSYYEKYLNGENSLERAFYPRQVVLDIENRTLVTDDYKFSQDLEVTNNVKMLRVNGASLDTVGGPNSNSYAANLVMTMGSDAYNAAFIGDYAESTAAAEDAVIALGEGNIFTIPVKWVEEFGKPETLVSYTNGEPFYLSLKSKKNGTWYERIATLDEEAGTLVIDPSEADYTAVDEAKAQATALERSLYTEESLAAVDAAVEAVETGKFKTQQAEVDAMAAAINEAISKLKKVPQSIALDKTEAKLDAGKTLQLKATVDPEDADQTVTWESSDETKATVDNKGVVKAVGLGAVTITAKTSNGIEATCAITIAKGNSQITLANKTATYTGKAININAAKVTGSTGAVTYKYYSDAECTKAVSAHTNAGTYYVKATVAADANYNAATSKAAKLVINKAASTITLKAKSATYTGKAINIGKATVKGSNGKVTYAYYSDAKCTKKVSAHVKAGTYYVKATVAANANYKAATSKAVKLVIGKADNPITAKPKVTPFTAKSTEKYSVSKEKSYVIKNAQGKVTFSKNRGAEKIKVASDGTITIEKGLKVGHTYTLKVNVKAAGNNNYKAKTVSVKIKIKVWK